MAAGIWEPNGMLGPKCFSNYCFHHRFVILRLDTQHPGFHAVAGEAACFSSHIF